MGSVSHPGDISVGPNQHGSGSSDCAKHRKLPHAVVLGVDQLNSIRPWRDVEGAGLTEVEQHWAGVVQQGEDTERAVCGDQVEIGHAASEQRVSLAEVVLNVQPGKLLSKISASSAGYWRYRRHAAKSQ
jgi:hypothetical protein